VSCSGPNRPRFTHLTPEAYRATIGSRLVNCVDRVRDINARLGLRPYAVRLVRTKWSGGRRGVGEEYVDSVCLIEPTPAISGLDGLDLDVRAFGRIEQGTAVVTEISGAYSEANLHGLRDGEAALPDDAQVWWEIEYTGDRLLQPRRRFVPTAVPSYSADKFQWTVRLTSQEADRTPIGAIGGTL
jgi:hypothetical protein